MSAPLRVAQVSGNLETGGMQMLVMEIMRNLDRSRFEPVLISLRNPNHFAEEIAARGWKHLRVDVSRRPRHAQLRNFASVLREERIDLIHSHADHANIASRAAGAMAGTRAILAHFHNTYEHRMSDRFRRVENRLAHLCDGIVCCGQGVEEFYRGHFQPGGTPVRTVVNGFNLQPFRETACRREELRRQLGFKEDEFVILHTARFEPHKHPALLLDALKIAAPRLGKWRCVYLGEGSLHASVRQRAAAEFPGAPIEFKGWSREVAEHLAASDVFVLCSRNEGLSLSIVEALACGLPVAASNIIGPREVIRNEGEGVLFSPGDAQSLAEAIVRYREDRDYWLAVSEQGRRRAEDFDIAAYMHRIHSVYEETLAARTAPREPLGALASLRLWWTIH